MSSPAALDPHLLELGPRLEREVLAPLKAAFVAKDEVVDLLGVSLVAGENLFILGPPGTAKSALVQQLAGRLEGRVFDYLLTRFTEPNELFGPFDIRQLRDGQLVTNTEGMLPEAELVFLDELLNANSAILNSLLTVLNERVFRRGREQRRLPLLCVVGASNRLPEDEALGALFDRFMLRVRCLNVPDERLGEVLAAGWQLGRSASRGDGGDPAQPGARFGVDEVRQLGQALAQVSLDPVRAELAALVRRLRAAGIAVSDRRAVKLQGLIAASALLCGRAECQTSDLWVTRYIWDTEEQIELLEGLTQELLKDADQVERSHPRSAANAPDAEGLARDLARIEARLALPKLATSEKAALRDRLSALAGRCQWVDVVEQRAALGAQLDALWQQLGA